MKPLSKPKPTSALSGKKEAEPPNYIHQNIIRAENIKKENFHLQKNRNENYQLNPFTCTAAA